MQQLLELLDANNDGKVARDEFVHGPTLMFDRADVDRNGIVDRSEMSAFSASVAARRVQ